jgi:hypothetical protein
MNWNWTSIVLRMNWSRRVEIWQWRLGTDCVIFTFINTLCSAVSKRNKYALFVSRCHWLMVIHIRIYNTKITRFVYIYRTTSWDSSTFRSLLWRLSLVVDWSRRTDWYCQLANTELLVCFVFIWCENARNKLFTDIHACHELTTVVNTC